MIDRTGKPIFVGWPLHHLEYLRAAFSLRGQERCEALWDISDMTGRSYKCCHQRMNRLALEDLQKAGDVARRLFVSVPTVTGQKYRLPPSAFVVSEKARMGGSARSVKSPIVSEA